MLWVSNAEQLCAQALTRQMPCWPITWLICQTLSGFIWIISGSCLLYFLSTAYIWAAKHHIVVSVMPKYLVSFWFCLHSQDWALGENSCSICLLIQQDCYLLSMALSSCVGMWCWHMGLPLILEKQSRAKNGALGYTWLYLDEAQSGSVCYYGLVQIP